MNQKQSNRENISFIILFLVIAAITRLIPHPFNFTAIGAMAIFSGSKLKDKRLAFILPSVVMLITDSIIGFHASMIPVYICFTIAVLIGIKIRNYQSITGIVSGSLISSLVFFLVTNLPFWYADISLYPLTLSGTLMSYTAAIPFFGNQIAGDLFYNAVFFGSYYLVNRKVVSFNQARIKK